MHESPTRRASDGRLADLSTGKLIPSETVAAIITAGKPAVAPGAQRHCLSIQHYREDIFLRLSQAAQHRPEELAIGSPLLLSLLPDRWGATHPQHVHADRREERRMVAENKLYYRLQAGLAGCHPYAAPVVI